MITCSTVCIRTENQNQASLVVVVFSDYFNLSKRKKPTAPEGFPARSPTTVLAGPSQA